MHATDPFVVDYVRTEAYAHFHAAGSLNLPSNSQTQDCSRHLGKQPYSRTRASCSTRHCGHQHCHHTDLLYGIMIYSHDPPGAELASIAYNNVFSNACVNAPW